jgi:hypothetical protein
MLEVGGGGWAHKGGRSTQPPSLACGPSSLVWGPLAPSLLGMCACGSILRSVCLTGGPSNPCALIFHHWEKAQLWSKGGCWFGSVSHGLWQLGRVVGPIGVVGQPPMVGPSSSFSLYLHRNTPWTCGTCYLIKYAHDMLIFLLFQGSWWCFDYVKVWHFHRQQHSCIF